MVAKLKVCGVQGAQEAATLVNLGVDYIGLNFVPSSQRCIDFNTAKRILNKNLGETMPVLLYSDGDATTIISNANDLGVKHIQLHGDETSDFIDKLTSAGLIVIKSVPIGLDTARQDIDSYIQAHAGAKYYLLDRSTQGSGEPVSLDLATEIARNYQIFLAGGINGDNVQQAIQSVQPYAIDVASGVRDGKKLNLDKLNHLLGQMEKIQ